MNRINIVILLWWTSSYGSIFAHPYPNVPPNSILEDQPIWTLNLKVYLQSCPLKSRDIPYSQPTMRLLNTQPRFRPKSYYHHYPPPTSFPSNTIYPTSAVLPYFYRRNIEYLEPTPTVQVFVTPEPNQVKSLQIPPINQKPKATAPTKLQPIPDKISKDVILIRRDENVDWERIAPLCRRWIGDFCEINSTLLPNRNFQPESKFDYNKSIQPHPKPPNIPSLPKMQHFDFPSQNNDEAKLLRMYYDQIIESYKTEATPLPFYDQKPEMLYQGNPYDYLHKISTQPPQINYYKKSLPEKQFHEPAIPQFSYHPPPPPPSDSQTVEFVEPTSETLILPSNVSNEDFSVRKSLDSISPASIPVESNQEEILSKNQQEKPRNEKKVCPF